MQKFPKWKIGLKYLYRKTVDVFDKKYMPIVMAFVLIWGWKMIYGFGVIVSDGVTVARDLKRSDAEEITYRKHMDTVVINIYGEIKRLGVKDSINNDRMDRRMIVNTKKIDSTLIYTKVIYDLLIKK